MTEEAEAEKSVSTTVQMFGRLDILVNSAGIIQAGRSRTPTRSSGAG